MPVRRVRGARKEVLGAQPVLAPLPHVAVHIKQAPGVPLLRTNGMRHVARVLAVPSDSSQGKNAEADRLGHF